MLESIHVNCPAPMRPHVRRVLTGEYDVAYEHPSPSILDIGANVGGFALWALKRWPNSFVYCFEPLPGNFEYLKSNLSRFSTRVTLYQCAVGMFLHQQLYLGKHHNGESSLVDIGEQVEQSVPVEVRHPGTLPSAEIVKIDVEGTEIEILQGLNLDFQIVILEYHSDLIRREADRLLSDYVLVGSKAQWANRGIVKYLNKKCIPEQLKLIWRTD
jgi:FkbM family methyltransferase